MLSTKTQIYVSFDLPVKYIIIFLDTPSEFATPSAAVYARMKEKDEEKMSWKNLNLIIKKIWVIGILCKFIYNN